MKLLVDMNLSPRWIDYLGKAGFDAVHWSAVGNKNAPDSEIMAYAALNDFVVLTHDLDFSAMLAASQFRKPSVIQIRADDIDPVKIGPSVLATLFQSIAELKKGELISVDVKRSRLRILPLRPFA
jgi:predicted nuclease of predicted toxin-antitoxin system